MGLIHRERRIQAERDPRDRVWVRSDNSGIFDRSYENEYPYTLDSEDWKNIQIKNLREGYESRSMR